MGLESLQSLQNLHISVPHSLSSGRKNFCARSYSLSSFCSLSNQPLTHVLGRSSSTLFSSSANLKPSGLKRSCSADSHQFFDEEFAKQIEDFARKFDVINDDDDDDDDKDNNFNDTASAVSEISHNFDNNTQKNDSSMSFLPSKLEFLEPNLLGILPEPPEWPERDEIVKITIQKANSADIPLSLRMIGRKQKWQEGFVEAAGDFTYCSMKKAFSSMVFMIRELQNYALSIRSRLYSEDLEAVVNKFHKEMNASFVWLFQQVFSRTPTLMVYVMLLLANFTIQSMADNIAASQSRTLFYNTVTEEEKLSKKEIPNGGLSGLIRYPDVGLDEMNEISEYQEMSEEEELELWNLMVEEASRLREESRYPVLDQETMKNLVSSTSVELEPDDYMEFHKTDLVYQMGVAEDPDNSLLLSNYAQFLYLVRHDYDRAEECFKQAIMAGPQDAETFSRYADFLWLARKDLWNAEEVYQQAMEAAPDSHYYASKYANFLWSTGGEDTCFPPRASYNEVM